MSDNKLENNNPAGVDENDLVDLADVLVKALPHATQALHSAAVKVSNQQKISKDVATLALAVAFTAYIRRAEKVVPHVQGFEGAFSHSIALVTLAESRSHKVLDEQQKRAALRQGNLSQLLRTKNGTKH